MRGSTATARSSRRRRGSTTAKLDVVIVGHRSPLIALLQVPWVFAGRIGRLPGVVMRTATDIEITSAHPVVYHVDGEPFVGGASLKAHVRPHALRIKIP